MYMRIVKRGNVAILRELCLQNNLPIDVELKTMLEGWSNKPKEMFQVHFERGFLDATKGLSYYTNDRRKDAFGNLVLGSSLRQLMREQVDFSEEETMLEMNARKLGVKVMKTPKCHPELAGGGIEYHWAAAKSYYQRLPVKK